MNTRADAVVVGIDVDGYGAALAFAVSEARGRGLPVKLVHVIEPTASEAYAGIISTRVDLAGTTISDALERAEELGRASLEGAVAAASELGGQELEVTAHVIRIGGAVEQLVQHSESASLVVVQHRARTRARRLLTGSVAHNLAGRAHCPLVSVPDDWSQADRVRTGVVTVGVQDAQEADELLRAAFVEARARGARVSAIHSWYLGSGYDTLVVDQTFVDEWSARARTELEEAVAPLRQEFPDVEVSLAVLSAPPAEALLEAAQGSDLVVLGRRHHLLPLGSHLGPVTRTLLDRSPCPVLVTPETAHRKGTKR